MDMFDDRVRAPAPISVRSSSLVRGCQAPGASTPRDGEDGRFVSERLQATYTRSTPRRGLEDKQQAHRVRSVEPGLMSNARANQAHYKSKLFVGEASPWSRCAYASK